MSSSASRVVAVLEALAESPAPLASSAVARRMGLSTSTTAVILKTLEDARYVERLPDKSYRLGAGLLRLVAGLGRLYPLLGVANEELGRLHADLGFGCSLARLTAREQEVVLTVGPADLLGIRPGVRLPMDPPLGTLAMAWRPPAEIAAWLPAEGGAVSRAAQLALVATVRELGYAVFGMEQVGGPMAGQIYDLLTGVQAAGSADNLRLQLAQLAFQFATRIYTRAQLEGEASLRVSHVIAPVFGADDQPAYLLSIHVMRNAVTPADRNRFVAHTLAAARALTRAAGGHWPAPSDRR